MRHCREAGYGQWLLRAPKSVSVLGTVGRVAKGTAAMWGLQDTSVGAPVPATAWCELLKSTLVWEQHCLLHTWRLFLQRGTEARPAGTVPVPVSQPCTPMAPAAPPASSSSSPGTSHPPPHTPHRYCLLLLWGKFYCEQKDLFIL